MDERACVLVPTIPVELYRRNRCALGLACMRTTLFPQAVDGGGGGGGGLGWERGINIGIASTVSMQFDDASDFVEAVVVHAVVQA